MFILEYENLGLFVKWEHNSFSLTEYKEEACTFSRPPAGDYLAFIDRCLIKTDPYYKLGKLNSVSN